ncbi:hypothetical protein [Variovorax sp. YR566]|uniref:hypothetical protein n=1 Tax=Variovorax sp. YR566 TaxID=3450237 RepID=UPI003F7F224D
MALMIFLPRRLRTVDSCVTNEWSGVMVQREVHNEGVGRSAFRFAMRAGALISCVALLAATALALAGCASHDPNLKRISGDSIELHEKLMFSAIAGAAPGVRHYHGLLPGTYKATMEDKAGRYYFGNGARLVLGGQQNADGTTEEPLAVGGFWLAKDKGASPPMRLFYLPKFRDQGTMVNGVIVNTIVQTPGLSVGQAGIAGALGGVIAGAIVESGAVGYGPKNGEPIFVPFKQVPDESLLFTQAVASRTPAKAEEAR